MNRFMEPCAACPKLVPLGVALCFGCLLVLPQEDRRALLGDLRADTYQSGRSGRGGGGPAPWSERSGAAAAAIMQARKTIAAIREDVARRAARAA